MTLENDGQRRIDGRSKRWFFGEYTDISQQNGYFYHTNRDRINELSQRMNLFQFSFVQKTKEKTISPFHHVSAL